MGIAIPQVITNRSGAQVIDGSLKFDQNVSGPNSLSKTFASSGNRQKITWSAWVRRGKVSSEANLFSVGNSSTDAAFRFDTDDTMKVRDGAGGELQTQAVFRDTGWYHIVVKIDTTQSTAADRFRLYVNGSETVYSATSYASQNADIDWNNNVNHYIGRQVHNTSNLYDGAICQVYFIDGQALGPENFGFTDPLTNTWKPKKFSGSFTTDAINNGTTWTSSANVDTGSSDMTNAFDGDTSTATSVGLPGGGATVTFTPPSAITVSTGLRVYMAIDRGQSISVNGSQTNASVSAGWNDTGFTGSLTSLVIGPANSGSSNNIAAIEIDGTILVEDLNHTGVNSFYLPMDNEDDFEKDKSGNGNNWTKNSFGGTSNDPDVLPDSPSGISYSTDSSSGITTTSQVKPTTWATLNPLSRYSALVPSDGNLVFTDDDSSNGGDQGIQATIMPTSGSYYWEVTPTALASENYYGVSKQNKLTQTVWTGGAVDAYFYYNNGKKIGGGNGNGGETYGSSFAVNDVIGVAVSWDYGTVTFYKNGVSQGVAFSGVDLTGYIPSVYLNTNQTGAGRINFGQKPFKYAAPDGYQPLCAANARPDKVISRPDQYVGVTTWRGNDTQRDIRTLNMKPDLVWIKQSTGSSNHSLMDTVRGATKNIVPNDTQSEGTETGYLNAFIDNGFSLGTSSIVNDASNDYVAWAWKAGGDKNTYNIDNVGYSTSADVGFDAGGLNDVAYNSSRTWSSNMVTTGNSGNWHASFPVTNAFNGNHSNYAHGNADGSASATVTLTFNPAIACEENVTFMGGFTNTTAGTGTISINGGPTTGITTCLATDPAATDLTVVPFTGDISTIVINKTSGGAQGMILFGFKIDGVELLDNGVTPTYNYPTAPSTGCSVGTKQGFSIVSYTGNSTNPSTHAHGLLKAPRFVVIKNLDRSTNGEWIVGHADAVGSELQEDHRDYGGFKEGHQLYLNSANAVDGGSSNWFSNSRPDRFTFTVKDNYQVNYAGDDYIAYLWHDVPGLQKFGYYIGNGSSDGPYVELGFRPTLLWIKNAFTGNETWCAHDTKRDPFNRAFHRLSLESNNAQTTANAAARGKDLLSNGFKIRGTSGEHNTSGERYIYCAWSEAPAIDLFGGGANAR